ncbi:MAG: bifunctional phosphoribosylaminoimidazolecarboxamide formyltransferase/IMP cyclohydrolase [Planctomycetota bacterium]
MTEARRGGPTRRALISVTDKRSVVEFAQGLSELGFSILSTGGTFRVLQESGVPAVEVQAYTGFPEMMGGRVKTLHPKVHGGLLARRDDDSDLEAMEVHGIDPIDILVVNLYRFRETVRSGASDSEIVEQIDIGGPAMIRSASKNHSAVGVVVDPDDYDRVLESLRANDAALPLPEARRLAAKAFAHTSSYDAAIADFLAARVAEDSGAVADSLVVSGAEPRALRYGENPHQSAALYRADDALSGSLAAAELVGVGDEPGKEPSYNNYLDLDAALDAVREFDDPACAIVKHGTPCGVAVGPNAARAFDAALDSDPKSAFGGIVALNQPCDEGTAKAITARQTFLEAIVAPSFDDAARVEFATVPWGKNLRLLALGSKPHRGAGRAVRSIDGGLLIQDRDAVDLARPSDEVPTERQPEDDEKRALDFAWRVVKICKSNAIVLAVADGSVLRTVGIGAGQTSRVDAVEQAVERAGDQAKGAVLASDAFFPFADGLIAAADAGVRAVVQPGGSRRDQEVLEAADARGVAMVFTRTRHFRH